MSDSYNSPQEGPSPSGLLSRSNSLSNTWTPSSSPPSQSSSLPPSGHAQEPARPSFIEQLGLQFGLDEEQVSILYAVYEVCFFTFIISLIIIFLQAWIIAVW